MTSNSRTQNLKISRVTLSDDLAKIIADIQSATWLEASEITPNDYSVEALQKHLLIPENIFCVAYNESTFAGMASAKIQTKPDGDISLYIDEVDVCKDMLRNGVGTAFMNYFLNFAKNHNFTEVWVGTEIDNEAAKSLYTSLAPDEVTPFVGYTFTL